MKEAKNLSAEQLFRASFERLKNNAPTVLAKGSPVTQNNVAREAGRDPSALKKDRYPTLILEIQAYAQELRKKNKNKSRTADNRTRTDKETIADLKKQNNKLCSLIEAMHSQMVEMEDEILRLTEGNILKIES